MFFTLISTVGGQINHTLWKFGRLIYGCSQQTRFISYDRKFNTPYVSKCVIIIRGRLYTYTNKYCNEKFRQIMRSFVVVRIIQVMIVPNKSTVGLREPSSLEQCIIDLSPRYQPISSERDNSNLNNCNGTDRQAASNEFLEPLTLSTSREFH